MAENNAKGSKGSSADDARLMDAYAARTGSTDDAVDPRLDEELQRELSDYLSLSRRIAAIDDQPVAASVRSTILSEAARVGAERAEQPRNGLVEMLLAMLRPGPVLAFGALAAIALAISVRQEPTDAQGPLEPSMHAMRASAKSAEAVALAPAPEAAAAMAADAPAPTGAEGVAGAAAPGSRAEVPGAPAQGQLAQEEAGAPTGGSKSTEVVELAVPDARDQAGEAAAKAMPRPSKTIAAEPASLGPIVAKEETPPQSKPAAPQAELARGTAGYAANDDALDQALPGSAKADNELRDQSSFAALRKREQASAEIDSTVVAGSASGAKAVAQAQPAPPSEEKAKKAATSDSKGNDAAPTDEVAGGQEAETLQEAKAAKAQAAPRQEAQDEQSKAAPRDVASADATAPAAPAPVAKANHAPTSTVDQLRKAIASAGSSAERVRLLEKLVAALDQGGRKAEAKQARTDLAEARASLAGASIKAKAAPERAKSAAPTGTK